MWLIDGNALVCANIHLHVEKLALYLHAPIEAVAQHTKCEALYDMYLCYHLMFSIFAGLALRAGLVQVPPFTCNYCIFTLDHVLNGTLKCNCRTKCNVTADIVAAQRTPIFASVSFLRQKPAMKLACAVQRSRFMWNEARLTRYGNVINDAEMYVLTYITLSTLWLPALLGYS